MRSLPVYQKHTLSSNTFRKNSMNQVQKQTNQVLINNHVHLASLIFSQTQVSDLQNYLTSQQTVLSTSFSKQLTSSFASKTYNMQISHILNSSQSTLTKSPITHPKSLILTPSKSPQYLPLMPLTTRNSSEIIPSILNI